MRTIAENAGTTPRSIYTRYEDKEGLFCALVDEPAKELTDFFELHMQQYSQRPIEEQRELFDAKSLKASIRDICRASLI